MYAMRHRKLMSAVVVGAVAAGGSAVALAAGSAPRHTTINAVTSTQVVINRYIQDGTRWQKDVYDVKSGGTITIVNLAASDGPHTFSVVKKSQLPRTVSQIENCTICNTLAAEHQADPSSNGPPKFPLVGNGVGTNTPPTFTVRAIRPSSRRLRTRRSRSRPRPSRGRRCTSSAPSIPGCRES